MVNASLNWASIVGIVLAVSGAGLYFMRSFKPALARDYDVFFAAIGLLCGGILFFQGWRLDPILQFGQFLLAGTTVFFAYESVRLRGVATDQARRSSYFDDDLPSRSSDRGMRSGWEDSYDQFEESQPLRRRFSSQSSSDSYGEERYPPRRNSRAAIPEEAESRRRFNPDEDLSWDQTPEKLQSRRSGRFNQEEQDLDSRQPFGDRRRQRQEKRRGTRPSNSQQTQSNRSRTRSRSDNEPNSVNRVQGKYSSSQRPSVNSKPQISRKEAEDAAFSSSSRSRSLNAKGRVNRENTKDDSSLSSQYRSSASKPRRSRPRDNSSRFDN